MSRGVALTLGVIAAAVLALWLLQLFQQATHLHQIPIQSHLHKNAASSSAFTVQSLDPARLNLLNDKSVERESSIVASLRRRRLNSGEDKLNSEESSADVENFAKQIEKKPKTERNGENKRKQKSENEEFTIASNEPMEYSSAQVSAVSADMASAGKGTIELFGGKIRAKEFMAGGPDMWDNFIAQKYPKILILLSGDPNLHFVDSPALKPPYVDWEMRAVVVSAARKFGPSWQKLKRDTEAQWPTLSRMNESQLSVALTQLIKKYESRMYPDWIILRTYYKAVEKYIA